MAITDGQGTPGDDLPPAGTGELEAPEDARDAWLTLALSDIDGGAAALATAARGGRPLPKTPKP